MAHDIRVIASLTGGACVGAEPRVVTSAMVLKSSELKESNFKLLRKAFPKLVPTGHDAYESPFGRALVLKFEPDYYGGDFGVSVRDTLDNPYITHARFALADVKELKAALVVFEKSLLAIRALPKTGARVAP